jgi:steroid delta-isomerase-like uncharacterized protein
MPMGLIVEKGPEAGETFELDRDVIIIGREKQSVDVMIADPAVSRRHARLTRQGNSYTIEDLKSSNGTFLNSQRISVPVLLSDGDVIELGKAVRLSYQDLETGEETVVMPDASLMTQVEPMPGPGETSQVVDEKQRAEEHRRLFARYFEEIWNRKDYQAAYELVYPDFAAHGVGKQDVSHGPEGIIAQAQEWHAAFPDGRMTLDDVITEGELASIRMTFRGTQMGTFRGVPASGNRIEVISIGINRVVDGKIKEAWGELNVLDALQQIGGMPGPEAEQPALPAARRPGGPSPSAEEAAEPIEERNKKVAVRVWRDVWNRGDLPAVDEIISDDYAGKIPAQPDLVRGKAGFRQLALSYRTAMPDVQLQVRDVIAEGDRVVAYWTASGTNTGRFGGMPPSYRRVAVDGVSIFRLVDGVIVQEWEVFDTLGFMQQLGAIPAMGAAAATPARVARPGQPETIEEQGKAVFNRWFGQAWNKGHYSVAYEVIDPRMRVHGAGGQPVEMGPDGLIGLISTWRAAFPDGQMSVDGLVAEGDLVAALLTWRGTQRGEFYGAPASVKQVACTSIGIDRVQDGIVRDGWGELDMVGLMQTIGALPLVGPGAVANERSPEWGSGRGDPIGWGPSSDNKDLGRRFIAAWNEPSASAFTALIDGSRYREFNPVFGVEDAMGAAQLLSTLRAAMPDLHFTQDESMVISDGDILVVHSVANGTHTGQPLFGAPAKGAKIAWTQTDWLRIAAGRVITRWVSADTLALLQQAGALPGAG